MKKNKVLLILSILLIGCSNYDSSITNNSSSSSSSSKDTSSVSETTSSSESVSSSSSESSSSISETTSSSTEQSTSTSTIIDDSKKVSKITEMNRNNEYIKYHGRNVHTNGHILMNNTASGFEVSFYGTKLDAILDAPYKSGYGYTQVSVFVDGDKDSTKNVIKLDKGSTKSVYTLVSGLSNGYHTIKVLKRTEAIESSMTLYELETDGYFEKFDKVDKLKIEAYGDSITAGYGNLRSTTEEAGNYSTNQNGLQTYATLTAWELDADINVQARSGIGLYKSGYKEGTDVNNYYSKVNYDGEYNWNFDNYTPDIVIINLGTNDYYHSEDQVGFKTEYVKLVSNLANIYGEDTSFILASGLMDTFIVDTFKINEIEEEIKKTIPNNVYRIDFNMSSDYNTHPLVEKHIRASEKLVKLIKDNNLNVIHQKEEITNNIKDIEDKNVNTTITVKLQDEIPAYNDLYLKGLEENIKLDKISNFEYQTSLTLKEGDYNLSFIVDNNEDYIEFESSHLIKVREDNSSIDVVLDSFLSLPIDLIQTERNNALSQLNNIDIYTYEESEREKAKLYIKEGIEEVNKAKTNVAITNAINSTNEKLSTLELVGSVFYSKMEMKDDNSNSDYSSYFSLNEDNHIINSGKKGGVYTCFRIGEQGNNTSTIADFYITADYLSTEWSSITLRFRAWDMNTCLLINFKSDGIGVKDNVLQCGKANYGKDLEVIQPKVNVGLKQGQRHHVEVICCGWRKVVRIDNQIIFEYTCTNEVQDYMCGRMYIESWEAGYTLESAFYKDYINDDDLKNNSDYYPKLWA